MAEEKKFRNGAGSPRPGGAKPPPPPADGQDRVDGRKKIEKGQQVGAPEGQRFRCQGRIAVALGIAGTVRVKGEAFHSRGGVRK